MRYWSLEQWASIVDAYLEQASRPTIAGLCKALHVTPGTLRKYELARPECAAMVDRVREAKRGKRTHKA